MPTCTEALSVLGADALPCKKEAPVAMAPRGSADQGVPNNYGRKVGHKAILIRLCQASSFLNLHGRVAGDIRVNLTCHISNGASLVAYFVAFHISYAFEPHLRLHLKPQTRITVYCRFAFQFPIECSMQGTPTAPTAAAHKVTPS